MSNIHHVRHQIETILADEAFWASADYHPTPADWASLEGLDELEGFGPIAGHPDRYPDEAPELGWHEYHDADPVVNERGDRLDLSFLGF